ncbi:MAG: PSP1 domain-containing protein [Anaerolineaceae bacterium]
MENPNQAYVVGIRFSKIGKIYNFNANNIPGITMGDQVVVETSRGWQLGEVVHIMGTVASSEENSWKLVDRLATTEDLSQRRILEEKEQELISIAKRVISEQHFEGVKIVSIEISLDSSKLTVLYSYEGENKIDLRSVKYELTRASKNAQVELRQIGPRDVAKIFGGMGACGLPTRCCSKFLTDFSSISIRMAKEQGISLTPAEITGMCGRLRCCLIYEYELYAENRKLLPKRNKRVLTPLGEGKVIDLLPLKLAVIVDLPQVGRREFNNSDVQVLEGNAPVDIKPVGSANVQSVVEKNMLEIGKDQVKPAERPNSTEKLTDPLNSKKDFGPFTKRRPKKKKRRPGNQENNDGNKSS